MEDFASLLSGGDRRSVGAADWVAERVTAAPECFGELWACLGHDDPVVRMRAADALEKATRRDGAPLSPYKDDLLGGGRDDGSKEVRWHLLVLCGRLSLGADEAAGLMRRLRHAFDTDPSRIVRVMALQTACDLARRHQVLAGAAAEMVGEALDSPLPSLRARAKKLAREEDCLDP